MTRIGLEIAHWNILLDFAVVLLCFILGSMVAGLLIQGRGERGKHPWYSTPLWITATHQAALRSGKILSYATGAAASVFLVRHFGYLSLLMSAAAIAVATSISFVRSPANT